MATNSQLHLLSFVYPPVSNQEASWLETDVEVQERLRGSDFYMIGGRAELEFEIPAFTPDMKVIRFGLRWIGGELADEGELVIHDLPGVANFPGKSFVIESGAKMIRIWSDAPETPGAYVLEWFTTEKLLFDRAHRRPGIHGLDKHRDLATYDLFYVGIASKGDTYERLLKNGHKKRLEILINEPGRYPGSKAAHCTYLFAFAISSSGFTTFDLDDVDDFDFEAMIDPKTVTRDAEKAFVKLLNPDYNEVKYARYPKGADGLYGAGLTRYGYVINEEVVFRTPLATVKGGFHPLQPISNRADAIFVEGDNVAHFVSGEDFPDTEVIV